MQVNDSLQLSTIPFGDFAAGGSIGAASDTVDIASSFEISQSTTGQVLSLDAPTSPASGREARIANVGTVPFVMFGVTVAPMQRVIFSWHGAWIGSGTAAIGVFIPVPKVAIATQSQTVTSSFFADGTNIAWKTLPRVTVTNIPDSMLGNPAVGLRLELVRYVNMSSYKVRLDINGGSYRSRQKNGFVHPANYDPANGITNPSGSNTGGGVTNNVAVSRISEWAVTGEGQVIDIDLGAYFKPMSVEYRDTNGNISALAVAKPTGVQRRTVLGTGRFKGYSRAKIPGYFAFRYSIIDPDNAQERVYGGVSELVVATNAVQPFAENFVATQAFGVPCVTVSNRFDLKQMQAWIDKQIIV